MPGTVWTYLFLSVVIAFSAFPLYWMFVIATNTDEALAKIPPQVLPGGQLVTNLREVFSMQDVFFLQSLGNSVIVSSVVTASVLFFCALAGFAFAKLRFKGRNALMVMVVLTMTVPNQLGVVALYILMGRMPGEGGWNGTLLAVIVPGLVTAFGVFYMRQFILDAVPDELVEAARMDGASTMRIFWSVVVPAVRPAMAVLGLLTFVATWNEFQWPLITLGGTDYPTSMVALSDLASGNYVLYRRVLAGALVATLPLLVMLFIGGRQIVRGIMEGAVKS
ncbi:carbohydrate ABC transporter permease [Micromonospora sp. DSM 115977]|uniref:Carbohydrate ABC transporter permease n=1 Tax=Micromonospora reichwaldensis TaxID=3075516 RepID=A0ABU2WSG3_9ACTN|nr:carbohydrate ABC transporter permease [Micromonospora sp. DSM 115977]MDT0528826.1 carbohydrate ABC transporter permease [Micromonospora sp. DSM 115977]